MLDHIYYLDGSKIIIGGVILCKWEFIKYDDGTTIIMEQKVQQWDVWIDIVSFHVVDLQRCCVNDVATTKGIEF